MPPMRGIGSTLPPAERMRAATAWASDGEPVPTTRRASTRGRRRAQRRRGDGEDEGDPEGEEGTGHWTARQSRGAATQGKCAGRRGRPGRRSRLAARIRPRGLAGPALAADRGRNAWKGFRCVRRPAAPSSASAPLPYRPRRPSGAWRRPSPSRWSTTSRRRSATSRPPRARGCRSRASAACCARTPAPGGIFDPQQRDGQFRVGKVSGTSLLPLSAEGMAGVIRAQIDHPKEPNSSGLVASTRSGTPGTTAA